MTCLLLTGCFGSTVGRVSYKAQAGWTVGASLGCIGGQWFYGGEGTRAAPGWYSGWSSFDFLPLPIVDHLRVTLTSGVIDVMVPLWIPALLVGAPTAWLFWRDRRAPLGHCPRCRYDLRGARPPSPLPRMRQCNAAGHTQRSTLNAYELPRSPHSGHTAQPMPSSGYPHAAHRPGPCERPLHHSHAESDPITTRGIHSGTFTISVLPTLRYSGTHRGQASADERSHLHPRALSAPVGVCTT